MPMSAQLVKDVQQRLGVPQTGTWDSRTQGALKAWQMMQELQETGELDDATFARMFPASKASTRPVGTPLMSKGSMWGLGLGLVAFALFLRKR